MTSSIPRQTAEILCGALAQRFPCAGVVSVDDGDYGFSKDVIATDLRSAATASLVLLLSYARGGNYGQFRDEVAPRIIGGDESNLDVRTKLAAQTFKHALQLAELLGPHIAQSTDDATLAQACDATLVTYLQSLGTAGRKIAGIVQRDSQKRALQLREADPALAFAGYAPSPAALWILWYAPNGKAPYCLWIEAIAESIWHDEIKPEIAREAERRRRNHEALAMPIHSEVVRLHSRAATPRANPAQLVFQDGSSISFGPLLDADTLGLVSRGIRLLGSLDWHRLLRWEVVTGYSRWIDGEPNPHVIEVSRGYGELAELLGIRDKAAPQRLRALLMAQRACAFPLPGPGEGTGNLIVLSEWQGSGRRPGRVRIELGSMLMPSYVHELARSFKGRELSTASRLVPLVPLPPFVGRDRDHGAQATLSMLVTRELRVRAAELFREGSVRIELDQWATLAAEAHIPRSQVNQQLRPILERWTTDGDDGPAFLKTSNMRRMEFTLGDAHEAARRFLHDAGEREAAGSVSGRRSVGARDAKRRRLRRQG